MFLLPLMRETEPLFYNLRMIIDNKVLTEPRAWHITKVNRLDANGITKITLGQDRFDQHKDYIELDDNGNIIGMWADYFEEGQLEPTEPEDEPTNLHSEITYSGTKPEIKVNGSHKKFTVNFYDGETPMPLLTGTWSYSIRDGEIITPISDPSTLLDVVGLSENQIKLKFIGDGSYIGKILIVKNTATITGGEISSNVELEIKSL